MDKTTTALLIGGGLMAGGAGRFVTTNPATEEPLGTAADGDAGDMDRAIAAARAAFDESDWSRDTALRVHCLRQLRDALNTEIDVLRDITVGSGDIVISNVGAITTTDVDVAVLTTAGAVSLTATGPIGDIALGLRSTVTTSGAGTLTLKADRDVVLADKCDHAKAAGAGGCLDIAVGQDHPALAAYIDHGLVVLAEIASVPRQGH